MESLQLSRITAQSRHVTISHATLLLPRWCCSSHPQARLSASHNTLWLTAGTAYDPPITIYMGKDKVESQLASYHPSGDPSSSQTDEELIKYALATDIWFHVDKLSSAHVYLRLPEDGSMPWDAIPKALLDDCAQLVKANSIEGNKKDNLTIIYTPADNLKAGKTGDMAVGQVSFHNDRRVKRVHVEKRLNPIVNRLTKTKLERAVDHEAERVEREKRDGAARRAVANEKKKADAELAKQREADKKARSYDTLWEQQARGDADEDEDNTWDGLGSGSGSRTDEDSGSGKGKSVRELEEDFM
ncbi:NFACT-R-1 domain-containing protein [Mycena kentingensis (nom. inval.)]|nr:NFACT-R-1 domain-containing protein [Mycena kentingensis (nom. inval.)]